MKDIIRTLLWTQLIALVLLTLLLYPQPGLVRKIIWGVIAAIFLLYLPGYRFSYVFFAYGELSIFERGVMSLAVSVAIVGFSAFYMQILGIAFYPMHMFVLGLFVIALCFLSLLRIYKENRL